MRTILRVELIEEGHMRSTRGHAHQHNEERRKLVKARKKRIKAERRQMRKAAKGL
jgi:hypothetical protein